MLTLCIIYHLQHLLSKSKSGRRKSLADFGDVGAALEAALISGDNPDLETAVTKQVCSK